MARTKKKVTEEIEKVEANVQETIPTTPKRVSKKKVTKVEPEVVKEVIEKSSTKNVKKNTETDVDKITDKKRKGKTSSVKDGSDTIPVEEKIEPVVKSSKSRKKKITEEVQKSIQCETPVVQNSPKPKKRTRKTKDTATSEIIKKEENSTNKKVDVSKPVIIDNILPKKTRKSKKDNKPKLSAVPPEKVEEVKEKVVVESPKKEWKPPVKTKDFYEFEEGKYVLGDVEELFDETFAKKVKASVKKSSKKNHGKDDNLGIYFFKVNEKVWDLIEYNNKILTANKVLILCKSELITKEGKLRFCRRFESKEKFRVYPEYTKDDYCLFFYTIDSPSPFIMLQDENLV
jgi:hypothetical protein